MADIQDMFHQVKVAQDNQDFLRFLWWPEGDLNQELVEYRMTVHLFGAVSSPSCACYALRKTAEDNQSSFSDEVNGTINRNFYMDDCLKSLPSEEAAVKMVQDLTTVCQRGGFHLTKWFSNNRGVLLSIPEKQRSKILHELNLDRDQLPVERALGLHWCVKTDVFKFKMSLKEQSHTRCGILSVVSSVYDPLGFLAPLTLPAKLILQDLCRRSNGWDDQIPSALQEQWIKWLRDLDKVTAFKVDRCLKPSGFGQLTHGQLHHFSDASESAYGTVTYLRMQNNCNSVHVSFMLEKARVAPLKQVTIPRLELTAAVLVRVDTMLRAELQLPLGKSCFWTDSTSVLKYIRNENRRFQTFVANRISTIRRATAVSQWRYVHTTQNPADEASRGLTIDPFLTNQRWMEGPEFLWKNEEAWPVNILDSEISGDDPEVKKELIANAVNVKDTPNATKQLIFYFSDWRRLKRSVAWILKIRKALQEMSQKRKQLIKSDADVNDKMVEQEMQHRKTAFKGQNLTPEDLAKAELSIISFAQQERFSEEFATLSSGKYGVKKESTIYKLDPTLEGGLRWREIE